MTRLSKVEVEQVVRSYSPQMGEVKSVHKTLLTIPSVDSGQRMKHYVIDMFLCQIIFAFWIGAFGINIAKDSLVIWAYYVLYIPYCLFMETLWGQTLGKMITGSVVINDYAEKPTFGNIVARTAVRLVPFLPMALLWQEVPYHDIWTKTYVVSKKEVARLKEYVNK